MKNPFEVNTPEGISAQDAYDLFVDVFTDFYQVPKIGHTFKWFTRIRKKYDVSLYDARLSKAN